MEASEDEGYLARNTLAGSRINTPLEDIPAQISIMTRDFLEDIAAINPEDSFKYSLNVEGVGEFQSSGEADDFASGTIVNLDRSRVRGVSSAAYTQNFFVTNIRHDNYNLDRITYSSGPNAVIYGLGSPGGIIDVQFKRASTSKAFGEVGVRVSQFGGGRVWADYNQPILGDKLAVRVALLSGREDGAREPSTTETDRAFLTFQAQPLKNISVRGWYENAELDVTAAMNTAWFDAVTPWIAAGRPLFDNGINSTQTPDEPYWSFIGDVQQVWVINDALFPLVSHQGRSVETAHRSSYHNVPFEAAPFGLPPGNKLLSEQEFNLRGNGSRMLQDSELYGAVMEATIGNNLALEVGYNKETVNLDSADPITQEFSALRGDPNMYLPDGVTPNPRAGQLYVQGIGRIRKYTDTVEELRVTGSYRLDLRDQSKWLGAHTLTLLYQDVQTENSRNTSDMRIVPDSAALSDVVDNFTGNEPYGGRFRYYLDESGLRGGQSWAAVQWPWDTIEGGPTGKGQTVWSVNNPYGSTFLPTYRKNLNKSYMGAIHSSFLDDRIITTLGYRKTDVTAIENNLGRRSSAPNAAYNNIGDLDPANNQSFDDSGSQSSYGIVVKVTDSLRLYYNEADTWDSPLGIHHEDDTRISAPVGDGRDLGVMVSLMNNKIFMRFNYFENSGSPLPAAIYQDKVLWRLWFIEQQIKPNGWQEGWGLRDGSTPPLTSHDPDSGAVIPMPEIGGAGFDTDPFPDYLSVVSDQSADGYEFELTANWPENWTFQLTASKSDVREVNIGKKTLDYVASRLDHWVEWAKWERGLPNYDGVYANNWTFINPAFNFMAPWLAHMMESDGKSNNQGRSWRVNLVGKYTFKEGPAKGLSIGSAVRFRSKNVIGYGTKVAPNPYPEWPGASDEFLVPDTAQPIYGSVITEFDAFATYRMTVFKDKADLKLQLNIRNLFDDDSLIEQKAISTGELVNYTYTTPREVILSATLSF